jgi:rSAM/selenodomain-associated transferase 1
MTENGVILFVKYPEPGRVKTRLSGSIGQHLAAGIYRAFVEDIARSLFLVKTDSFVYYHPDWELKLFRTWLGNSFSYHRQTGSNLGVRMKNAFSEKFAEGYKRLLLIGSDMPYISNHIIEKGFESLDSSGCVIGPAEAGGYYLIGFRRDTFRTDVFDEIAWSTRGVLRQTENKLNKEECDYVKLTRFRDMDRFDDIRNYYLHHGENGGIRNRTIEFIESNLKQYFEERDLLNVRG